MSFEIEYRDFQVAPSDEKIEKCQPFANPSVNTKVRFLTAWTSLPDVVPDWKFFPCSSLFLLECGGQGHCMFHVLAAGLNLYQQKPVFSMQQLRDMTAKQVSVTNMKTVLSGWATRRSFTLQKQFEKVKSAFDLQTILTDVQQLIQDSRYQTWGDTTMLSELLLKSPVFRKLQLGFAIVSLRFHEMKDKTKRWVASTQMIIEQGFTQRVMTLYCHPQQHWQLLGLKTKNDQFSCVFRISRYPKVLHRFLKEQEYKQKK
jgi:hypothetical protein